MSEFKKVKKYNIGEDGDTLLSQWTSSQTVEMDDGEILENTIDGIKSDLTSHTHTIANVDGLQDALNGKQPSGSYAVTNAANTFNGEQKMINSEYCPTMNDIASGVGCSLKNSRACDNQLIVAEIYAPSNAITDSTLNMTSTVNEIPFYAITSKTDGKIISKTLLGKITSNGWEGNVKGNASSATALTTSEGSATQPVYFSGGKPVATMCTLGKSVPSDAKFTDTVYIHPSTHAASMITGLATVATSGKYSDLSGVPTIPTKTSQLTNDSGFKTTDTTYGVVSTTTDGLAPKRDGSTTKFLRADGTWATPPDNNTVYTHPTTSGNKHIPSGGSSGQILKWSADGTAVWSNESGSAISGVKGNAESSYRTGNVNITPANIGLGNVNNTSDTNKPVSTAQQEAIDDALATAKTYADTAIGNLGLNGFKTHRCEVGYGGSNYILSNAGSAYNIFISKMALIILQIGQVANVYSVYNTGSTFMVAPVILNQSANHGTVIVNSSKQIYINNSNTSSNLRCFVLYV